MTIEPTDAPTLALTGVTGFLGGGVARSLSSRGIDFRMLARSVERAPEIFGCPAYAAEYRGRAGSEAALAGTTTLFMVSAAESEDRLDEHRSFIDAAVSAGVQHIVYISFFGASPTASFTLARDHAATEEYIVASGVDHTFLRDDLYIDFLPSMVGEDGVLRGPAGDGLFAPVSRRDIIRVAAAVLADPSAHAGRTYSLTGPEDLTMSDVADLVGRATGRDVRFQNETLEEARASRAPWGAPDWQVDAWISTYTAIAEGELAGPTTDVETITGRAPESLAEFLERS